MQFVIKTEAFQNFLQKCKLQNLVKDLVLWATKDGIFAKISNQDKSIYCEVYESNVKVSQEGSIRIAILDKLCAALSRSSSECVMLLSNEKMFVVSDGEQEGKFRVEFVQTANGDFVESFQRIKNAQGPIFDKEKLLYGTDTQFDTGYAISQEALLIVLKDAKAFGFEIYKFKDIKKGEKIYLQCSIEDKAVGEKFIRVIPTLSKIGIVEVKPVVVGLGFKEMVSSLDKESKGEDGKCKNHYSVYFHDKAILITDNQKVYYILNSVLID